MLFKSQHETHISEHLFQRWRKLLDFDYYYYYFFLSCTDESHTVWTRMSIKNSIDFDFMLNLHSLLHIFSHLQHYCGLVYLSTKKTNIVMTGIALCNSGIKIVYTNLSYLWIGLEVSIMIPFQWTDLYLS